MLPTKLTATLIALTLGLPAVAQDGPLKSALDSKAPPFAMPKLDGSVEGMTVDMTNAIAAQLGREITIDGMAFSALLPALQAGTYDFLSVPLSPSAERAQSFLFTEGIWGVTNAFLLPQGSDPVAGFEDLNGKVIATNQGTLDDKWLRDHSEEYGWTVESYGSLNDAAQAVQAGRADASMANHITAITIAKNIPGLSVSDFRYDAGGAYVYAVPKTSPELRNQIDAAIECIKQSGEAAAIYEKWLGEPAAEGSVTVTPQAGYGVDGFDGFDATEHALDC